MTYINIEATSNSLKKLVSKYDTIKFLGEISSLMAWINVEHPTSTLKGLTAPQKQLFYVAALNITSPVPNNQPLEELFSDEDWESIKILLKEIETGYEQLFIPKAGIPTTNEWIQKRAIAMPAFFSYYNYGFLNYEEQVIERVINYFTPYDAEIQAKFGLSVQEFLDIYNLIDSLPNKFLMDKINPTSQDPSWGNFIDDMQARKLMPWQWQEHLPVREKNFFEFIADKGSMFRFSTEILFQQFGQDKTNLFLELFTCERKETPFCYYTEENPLLYKPIFKIDNQTYQAFELNYLVLAIYNVLTTFCNKEPKLEKKFTKHRGNCLEQKVERLFRDFLGDNTFIHKCFFTDETGEQDLLFLHKGVALVVE